MTVFGDLHARWYDRWFHAKDYAAEVDQLRALFAKEDGAVHSILDIGCGTGQHLELLAREGFEMVGVDRSPAMVQVATERLAASGTQARIVVADAAGTAFDRTFDAVIMMSWVLSYHVTNEELNATLAMVHEHLRPGGLLVFDIMDGTTLLQGGARSSFNVVGDGGARFVRTSNSTIDHAEQSYEIDARMWLFEGERVTDAVQEAHHVRYFLPRELDLVLELAGFEPLGSAQLAGNRPWAARSLSHLYWARKPIR